MKKNHSALAMAIATASLLGTFQPLMAQDDEGAEDLMSDFVCKAGMDERISHVLERMIDKGVEEIPVVDEEMKVISDVTMIDLLRAVTKEGRAES